jgi:hypothetical protein
VRRVLLLAVAAVAVASLLGAANGSASRAQATTLTATVGPGASITLQNPQGARVTRLDPGAYQIVTPRTRLVLTSGPSFTIGLRTAAGKRVRSMRVGTYTMVVRDRSRLHNARVIAPGYRRATTVPFVGQQRWRVRLARPGTLRFLCDPHASTGMRGSARIVR